MNGKLNDKNINIITAQIKSILFLLQCGLFCSLLIVLLDG
jgi:hypothetical protein